MYRQCEQVLNEYCAEIIHIQGLAEWVLRFSRGTFTFTFTSALVALVSNRRRIP